jgi:opacity protein-like surface antigen
MWGRGFTRMIGIVSLLAGSSLPGTQAVAQGATDHWLGWYAGGALGVSWTDVDIAIPPSKFSDTYTGFTGGIVAGYNAYVTDRHLVGLEADLTFNDVMGGFALSRHKVSLLGRVGRFRSPSMLFFAVAGLSGGQYRAEVTATSSTTMRVEVDEEEVFQNVTTTLATSSNRNKRLWGYTIGAGFEREGTIRGRDIRWGMEYRFTDFEDWNFTVAGQAFNIDPEVHELRFRLVVPFQRAEAPLLK